MTILWLLGVRPQCASGHSTDAEQRRVRRTELLGSTKESGIGTRGYGQAEPHIAHLSTVHASLHLLHHLATEGPEAVTAQPQ